MWVNKKNIERDIKGMIKKFIFIGTLIISILAFFYGFLFIHSLLNY